jgi:hypothetical protein
MQQNKDSRGAGALKLSPFGCLSPTLSRQIPAPPRRGLCYNAGYVIQRNDVRQTLFTLKRIEEMILSVYKRFFCIQLHYFCDDYDDALLILLMTYLHDITLIRSII